MCPWTPMPALFESCLLMGVVVNVALLGGRGVEARGSIPLQSNVWEPKVKRSMFLQIGSVSSLPIAPSRHGLERNGGHYMESTIEANIESGVP